MNTFPVLGRELRRLVRPDLTWGWMILVAIAIRWNSDGRDHPGIWAALAAVVLSLFWAHRTIRAELEDETIEHLGTLPIGAFSVLAQVGAGAALAAILYALPILVLGGAVTVWDLEVFVRGAGLAMVAGWLGAMGGFRFGENVLLSGVNMLWMGFLLSVAGSFLVAGSLGLPLPLAVPFTLAAGLLLAALVFGCWRAAGGHWVESLLPDPTASLRAAAAAEHAIPGQSACWLTPDGVPPLAWHELRSQPYRMAFATAFPALLTLVATRVYGACFNEQVGASLMAAVGVFVPLILTLSVAGSTARYRRQGLWDDLMVAPVSAHAIVLGHVAPPIVTLFTSLALWLVAWCGASDGIGSLTWGTAAMLASALACGTLCGFLAGALTTGWRAGLLSLVVVGLTVALFSAVLTTLKLVAHPVPGPALVGVAAVIVVQIQYWLAVKRVSGLREGA